MASKKKEKILFENGDVIRCYRDKTMRNWEMTDVYRCEYEKGQKKNFGFINDLGQFLDVDFKNANILKKKTKWGDGVQITFEKMENCKKTQHSCEIHRDELNRGVWMDCDSKCLVQ